MKLLNMLLQTHGSLNNAAATVNAEVMVRLYVSLFLVDNATVFPTSQH